MSKQIKTMLIDCDGVLSDSKVHYTHDGQKNKSFHGRDIRAIKEIISHGIDVVIVTQSAWPGIKDYAYRTGAMVVITREKSILAVQHEVGALDSYCYIGDDSPDIDLMSDDRCVRAFCPADADPSVHQYCEVLSTKGGEGVVAEVVRILSTQK